MIIMKIFVALSTLVIAIDGYCWQRGRNTEFTGPPAVKQTSPEEVEVDWQEQIMQPECADNILVKYWEKANPASYELLDVVPKEANSVNVKVRPGVTYEFQVIAREDKGLVGGIQWFRSQRTEFTTTGSTTTEKMNDANLQFAMVWGLLTICVLGNI